ncbi:MAG: NADP-dependent oxidoreductase [Nannocystaceae bacterium]
MIPKTSRQLHLVRRPHGEVQDSDFELRSAPVRAPEVGEIVVETRYLSIDPTNRIWMTDAPQYMPPVAIGDVMRSLGVGVVVASQCDGIAVGDHVSGMIGWREVGVGTPEALGVQRIAVPEGLSASAFLGLLGITGGMTAYFGLLDIGAPKPGETVVVSAAAGSVGSLAGQIAKIHGCRVIGVAGGPEKCAYVKDELGFDDCVDYKSADLTKAFAELCPDGIDVYFDNVGGDVLDAVLENLALKARIVLCGLISSYNDDAVRGPAHFEQVLMRRARIEGFIILDFAARYAEAAAALARWYGEGKLNYRETIARGDITSAPAALRRLLRGDKIGKLVLALGDA